VMSRTRKFLEGNEARYEKVGSYFLIGSNAVNANILFDLKSGVPFDLGLKAFFMVFIESGFQVRCLAVAVLFRDGDEFPAEV